MQFDNSKKSWLLNLACVVFLAFTFEVVMGCSGDQPSAPPAAADAGMMSTCGDSMCAGEQVCVDGNCLPNHCADGMASGDETMVDCGGSCPACSSSDAGVSMDAGSTDMGLTNDGSIQPDSGSAEDGSVEADMGAGPRRCDGRVVTTSDELAELEGCEIIDGDLTIAETDIADLMPLAALTEVTGVLSFRSNPSLASLAALSNLTSVFTLTIESNPALVNLSGLMSLATIPNSLTMTGNNGLRDLSTLNGLTGIGGTININNNPVLCQVQVLHFVDQQLRRNPGTSTGDTTGNGAEEPACGPLCAMECLDGGECYGDFYTEGMFCQDTCRGVIDCSEVSFCREIEGCVRTLGCQDGQPCAEECAKACEYPGPCMADEQCPEGSHCDFVMVEDESGYCRANCQSSDDCSDNRVCVGEVGGHPRCVEGCLEDADCGAEATCVGANVDNGTVGQCEFEFPPTSCEAPRSIGDGSFGGDTTNAPALLEGSCGGDDSGETVFAYQPAAAGLMCADTIGSSFDTLLHVRSGSCDSEGCQQLGCNDDDPGRQSRVRFEADPAQIYFIIVDGYSEGGRFTLNVGPCAEDDIGMGAQDSVACP